MSNTPPNLPDAGAAAAPRPLKVLHFVSGGFSGATQVAIDLCGNTAQQETLLVLRRRMMNPVDRVRVLRERGLAVQVVPRWSHLATIIAVKRVCAEWAPDVFVAHGFSEHLWGRYAALLSGVPRILQVEHNTRERYGRWRLWQSLWLARHTDAIVGVSEAVRDALVKRGHPAELCTVIHNGIELPRWNKGLPWQERENAIVMPARFARQKDHDTLIRALAELRSLGHTPTLYLAGEGKASWRANALRTARKLGVQAQVQCLGHVSDLPSLLGRVKLCVLSTHYEGLGLGLIEGMASGCCGVGSDVEGVQEIITHGQTGVLVPHADPKAMALALAQLLNDTERTRQLAEAGQRSVVQAFDRRRMRQQYIDLFHEIAQRPSSIARTNSRTAPRAPH